MLIYLRYYLSIILFGVAFSLNLTLHDYDNPSASHILDAEVVGNTLIIVGWLGGIDFYDISDPSTLNHLTNFSLGGGGGGGGSKPICASASGDYLYVTSSNGVAILNISNPSNPQNLGFIPGTSSYTLENLDIHENILAVAAHGDGVLLYDISNPENPEYSSTIQAENAWAVAVDDYHIYVADGSTLLDYFLVNNEYIPLAIVELPNAIKDIAIDNDYLYAAIGSDGVAAIYITVNVTPQVVDIYNTTAMANRLNVFDGNKVAVSDWDDVEVLSLDFDSGLLNLVGYKNTTRRTMAITSKDNYIYSAEWNSVQVFEFGEINGPDLDLSAYELNFPYVESGESYTLSLDVINNGNQSLDISTAYLTNNEFMSSPLENLDPGESQTVDVTYTANSINSSGSYRIFSNDTDQSEVLCEVNGNINGANIGDQAPDFELPIVANGTGSYRLSDHLGEVIVLAFFAPN